MRTVVKILIVVLSIGLAAFVVSCGSANSDSKHEHTKNAEGLYTCGMHPEVILEGPGQCPICGMNLTPLKQNSVSTASSQKPDSERKILYWQAPMNPEEIYDEPGKSNMGMDLVPVYDDQTSSGSQVSIDPSTVQNMGVRTATVQRRDFSRNIRALGKIDYNEENIYEVSSKISGWIEKLYVDYTGKPVRKGQALLELYSPDLVTTQQEYLLALKNRELISESSFASIREGAESLLSSTRQRLAYWDIPEKEILRLEDGGVVSKTITFESPADGIVIHKNAVEGKHIKEGSSLYRIADLSTIWVFASLYDNEVPWVEVGQTAEMELSYAPGKILKGKVAYIYPYLNEKSRDVKVRLEFPNPDMMLKPGMYANVSIKTQSIKDAMVIPSESVIRSGERILTFIAKGEGRFEPRPIKVGQEGDNGEVLVLAGLTEGEEIVTSAQFLLDSESRLQEAIQKMLSEKSAARTAMEPEEEDMETTSMESMEQDSDSDMDHSH
ncbi:MAG: efflux RND transporter periplasmic adaptor subunit [Candidatus Marinimicrobia bacterium]|nr:efflux RND transporter periplasmic adaptor subunit [Candidatus Neomarinimicrobiota bacterium]